MLRPLLSSCLLLAGLLWPAQAAELVQMSADEAYSKGMAAFQKGDYTNAIRLLAIKARKDPGDGTIYYYLGSCYFRTKQSDQAAHMYAACLRKSATTKAAQYSLQALEAMAALAKTPAAPQPEAPDPAAVEAAHDALLNDKPIDERYNQALKQAATERAHFKVAVDRVWEHLQDDIQGLSPRTPNYQYELERLRREAEMKVLALQTQELRHESRLIAPDKIDIRAVPQIPTGKIDDAKNALGSLLEYLHPDKPFDPFAIDVTPEVAAKFLSIKDAFGELATYSRQARKLGKELFVQLKSTIENRQDSFDRQINDVKSNLIKDIIAAKISQSGNPVMNSGNPLSQLTPAYQLSITKLPRTDSGYVSPLDAAVSDITNRALRRIHDLEQNYDRDVNDAISGSKERLSALIGNGGLASQLKHQSGNMQIVPTGTNVYTRNYVNFGERTESQAKPAPKAAPKSR